MICKILQNIITENQGTEKLGYKITNLQDFAHLPIGDDC